MKRWNLFELFSQLDLPKEQLPPLYTKDEISYRNVQKKVISRITSQETIEINEEKKPSIKRIILGFGVAAALLAGGVGTYAVSNAGAPGPKETNRENIQSTMLADPENELDYSLPIADPIDPNQFTEVESYSVQDQMDKLDLEDVKMQLEDGKVKLLMHFTWEDTETSILDTQFSQSSVSSLYNCISFSPEICLSLSDSQNLYYLYTISTYTAPVETNSFHFAFDGIVHKDSEHISDLGLKNLMGFTGAEISQGKAFTEEQLQQIDAEYAECGGYRYRREDVFAEGSMVINIDLTDEVLDKESLPQPLDLNLYEEIPDAVVQDSMTLLDGEVVGMRKDGYVVKVLLRYTPQNGYIVTGDEAGEPDSMFTNAFQQMTGIEEGFSEISYLSFGSTNLFYTNTADDKTSGGTSYYDDHFDVITYNDDGLLPQSCIYQEIQMTLRNLKKPTLELTLNSEDDPTGQFDGEISFSIPLGDITGEMDDESETDTFTTENGVEIQLTHSNESLMLEWDTNEMPDFLEEYLKKYNIYNADEPFSGIGGDLNFSVVTKDGLEYPLTTDIHIFGDGRIRACSMYDTYIWPEDLYQIKFGGEVIYQAE
ncbi:MAG: hypothetical protein IJ496_10055 [Ruminococcus sp.]|nr:hypothetical protein [Ruminococcus sp.]